MTQTPRQTTVTLPALFDSEEPLFITQDAGAAATTEPVAVDCFDGTGGGDGETVEGHDTCTW